MDPEGADVILEDDEFEETGTIDASTPAEAAFLERRGVGTKSWASDKRFRIQEQAICTKRTIRVAGTVRRVTPSPETHGCELALSADDGDELYISNMSDAALTKPTTLYLVGTWLLAGGLLSIFVGGVMAYFESR